jgi:hypothetical protein
MIDEIRSLLDQYAQWVRDKSVLREVNEQYVEITTPWTGTTTTPRSTFAGTTALSC